MSKKKETPKFKTTKEKRLLKCILAEKKVYQAGQDLAEALDTLRRAKQERESITKGCKAREAELEAKITTKQLLVRDKCEMRDVECDNILDYKLLRCRVVRLDTAEIIIDRKMTEDEKQSTLPFDDLMMRNNAGFGPAQG